MGQLLLVPSALNWQELGVLIIVTAILTSQFVLHRVTGDKLNFTVNYQEGSKCCKSNN